MDIELLNKKVKIFTAKGFKYEGTIIEETDLFYELQEGPTTSLISKHQIERIIIIDEVNQ